MIKRSMVGITAPEGFSASGVHCGIRDHKPDLALLFSDRPAAAAAVYTRNRIKAAPLLRNRGALERTGGRAQAVLVNSGIANACTGEQGNRAAVWTAEEAGRLLGIAADEVLVGSTGVIGVQLPLDRLAEGLPLAVERLAIDGGPSAARAILTTDTHIKEAVQRVHVDGGAVYTVGGMAKGSGMIHPDLATTLGFVTTDVAIGSDRLQEILRRAADRSFNRISVDGDTSTNDMIIVLANGASGIEGGADEAAFETALTDVLVHLAREVVRDGEGATRLIAVRVSGAVTEADAVAVARTISTSPLVKTAVFGADANWGRVVAAAGRAGVAVAGEKMTLRFSGLEIMSPGYHAEFSEPEATALLSQPEVEIWLDLGLGSAEATAWTCDLNQRYIDINAGYRT